MYSCGRVCAAQVSRAACCAVHATYVCLLRWRCLQTFADKLGLRRHPLRGPGMVSSVPYNIQVTALEVLDEPLTLQLLAGPDNPAMEVTLATVLVVPNQLPFDTNVTFELQLGLFDFVRQVRHDWLPLWASQFEDRESGFCCAVPVVAPLPPNVLARVSGSSTFHITQESYDEVRQQARRVVLQ